MSMMPEGSYAVPPAYHPSSRRPDSNYSPVPGTTLPEESYLSPERRLQVEQEEYERFIRNTEEAARNYARDYVRGENQGLHPRDPRQLGRLAGGLLASLAGCNWETTQTALEIVGLVTGGAGLIRSGAGAARRGLRRRRGRGFSPSNPSPVDVLPEESYAPPPARRTRSPRLRRSRDRNAPQTKQMSADDRNRINRQREMGEWVTDDTPTLPGPRERLDTPDYPLMDFPPGYRIGEDTRGTPLGPPYPRNRPDMTDYRIPERLRPPVDPATPDYDRYTDRN